MKAHKLFCAGAAMALLGAPAQAQEQTDGFFAGLKLRGAAQLASREDNLMPIYLGFGLECGYQFGFGRLSAELGYMYKPGRQYKHDLKTMDMDDNASALGLQIDMEWAVDSRKNQLEGLVLRLAYEKPFNRFSLKGGVQVGSLKFRQEYMADITDVDGYFEDTYNGVHDKGNMTFSPFAGVSFPFLTHHFVEINLVGLNYKSVDYAHVAGTVVNDWGGGHTSKDYIKESSRFIPHLEVTFGFRF